LKPSPEELTWLHLPARPESLAAFRAFALARARELGLPEAARGRIDLVLEEVLLNIFHYAYEGRAGQVSLGCGMVPGQGFLVRLKDQGQPFDPLQHKTADITLAIEEREIGGLGILLAREMSSAMAYHRREDSNILDIFFRE
jgi:anti-sigma regulatory factor (Ser/Thr protein kinase)